MTATGPGGTATASSRVDVNTAIQANLALAPGEVRYVGLGNEVLRQSSAELNWNVSNASSVSLDPLGSVDPSGNRRLHVTPRKNEPGPIDETITYTLTATNGVGQPKRGQPLCTSSGRSKKRSWRCAASIFKLIGPEQARTTARFCRASRKLFDPLQRLSKSISSTSLDARLILSGYADRRGSARYNKQLSDRRAIRKTISCGARSS